MFFTLSKVLWAVARPSTLSFLLLAVGLLLAHWRTPQRLPQPSPRRGWRSRRAWGWAMVWLGFASIFICHYTTVPYIGLAALENSFPRPPLPADPTAVSGIILLGGAVSANAVAEERNVVVLNGSAERVTETIALARRYPQAQILLSGFSGLLDPTATSEAEFTRRLLIDSGIDPERLILEDKSRNTADNAALTVALIGDQPPERWLLVTSAWHMPRAMGCFAQQGWVPVAMPTDYHTSGEPGFDLILLDGTFGAANVVLHEAIGLLAYWLTDRIPLLFPNVQSVPTGRWAAEAS